MDQKEGQFSHEEPDPNIQEREHRPDDFDEFRRLVIDIPDAHPTEPKKDGNVISDEKVIGERIDTCLATKYQDIHDHKASMKMNKDDPSVTSAKAGKIGESIPTHPSIEDNTIVDVTCHEQKASLEDSEVVSRRAPYSCSNCGKSIENSNSLHQKRCRAKLEGKHQCAVCGKCYSTRHSLRRHMYLHTGEKKYKCRVCSKAFADNSTRNRHERNIHTCEISYGSPSCSSEFTQTGNSHTRTIRESRSSSD